MVLAGIAVLVFLGGAFAVVAYAMDRQSKDMSDRFTSVVIPSLGDRELPQELRLSLKERLLAPMVSRLVQFAARLTPRAAAKGLTLQLERAGRPWGFTPEMWTLTRTVLMAAGVGAGLVILKSMGMLGAFRPLVALAAAAAGMVVPGYVLDIKTKERQGEVRRALPDVIDLLVVSVEAGLGLDAAVQEVINRRHGPLLEELARVLAEIRVGKTRRQAWQEMASRVDVLEIKVFVASLVQAEELGASVAGVLKSQGEALRVRRSLSIREIAAVLPVKMLFPLIFFIFPSMFVVILGPGMINLVSTFSAIGF
jgi:tight adherence protein C